MSHKALIQALDQALKPGYYFITPSSDNPITDKPVIETVEAALLGGAKIVQYREKLLSPEEMLPIAQEIRKITTTHNALFIVNDYVDLARKVNADGVHVGQEDLAYSDARNKIGSDKIIGVSATNYAQAIEAIKVGADYIGLGPIYATKTKLDAKEPCCPGIVTKLKYMMNNNEIRKVPIVVIGGIGSENYKYVIQEGADAICAISEVLKKDDISAKVASIIEIVRQAKQ